MEVEEEHKPREEGAGGRLIEVGRGGGKQHDKQHTHGNHTMNEPD